MLFFIRNSYMQEKWRYEDIWWNMEHFTIWKLHTVILVICAEPWNLYAVLHRSPGRQRRRAANTHRHAKIPPPQQHNDDDLKQTKKQERFEQQAFWTLQSSAPFLPFHASSLLWVSSTARWASKANRRTFGVDQREIKWISVGLTLACVYATCVTDGAGAFVLNFIHSGP